MAEQDDQATMDEVKRLIGDSFLVTNKNGKVEINDSEKRLIAIYQNGALFVAQGEHGTQAVRNIISRARREDIATSITKAVTLRPEQVLSLYEEDNKSGHTKKESDVKRQREAREIINDAVAKKASDIHIIMGKQGYTNIWFRSFGRRMRYKSITNDDASRMIEAIFTVSTDQAGQSALNTRQAALDQQTSGLLPPSIQLARLQYTPQNNKRGALVMRLIPYSTPGDNDIAKLGYSKQHLKDFAKMRRRTNGLYVLAGKVSSGKTTTLQRTLNTMYLEKNREILIFSIEDPVELELEDAIQMVAKPQPNPNDADKMMDGFEAGIASLLRSDANVGVLGEIRVAATAQRAIEAVMTGHALWTTVHTGSALRILGRLLDLGVEPYKLADPDIVAGLIYQRLVGKICPVCRIRMDYAYKLGLITKELAKDTKQVTGREFDQLYVRGNGRIPDFSTKDYAEWKPCPNNCLHGLVGRTVVAEVIRPDEKILADFARNKDPVAARQYWSKPESEGGLGGKPTIHHALTKVGAGMIDVNEVEEEVDFVATYIKEYNHLIPTLHEDVKELIGEMEGEEAAKKIQNKPDPIRMIEDKTGKAPVKGDDKK